MLAKDARKSIQGGLVTPRMLPATTPSVISIRATEMPASIETTLASKIRIAAIIAIQRLSMRRSFPKPSEVRPTWRLGQKKDPTGPTGRGHQPAAAAGALRRTHRPIHQRALSTEMAPAASPWDRRLPARQLDVESVQEEGHPSDAPAGEGWEKGA